MALVAFLKGKYLKSMHPKVNMPLILDKKVQNVRKTAPNKMKILLVALNFPQCSVLIVRVMP